MIIDIILILLIAFSAYRGYKKGLVGILVSIIALVLAIILGFVLKEPVSNFLYKNTGFGKSIEESVTKVIEENITKRNESINAFEELLSKQENQNSYEVSQLPKVLTMFILQIISFVIILVVVYLACFIVQMVLNVIFNLPIISIVNKFGGAGINILQMLVKIWIVLAIVYFVAPIQKTNKLSDVINNSLVTKTLYENNFFVSVIESNVEI